LNLFWLFLIIRVAYRYVWLNDLKDERSDNDEDELAEEMRLDALARQGVDGVAGKKVLLNGKAGKGESSAREIRTDRVTNRRAV
jgi:acyl-CoA-dependent ceramide synthase